MHSLPGQGKAALGDILYNARELIASKNMKKMHFFLKKIRKKAFSADPGQKKRKKNEKRFAKKRLTE